MARALCLIFGAVLPVFLAFHAGCGFAYAEKPAAAASGAGLHASSAAALDSKAMNPDHSLQKRFYKAVNQIYVGNLGGASRTLESLKNFAKRQGYVNLPDFSFELLNRALRAQEAGKLQEVSYFVHHSILLSPEDPRVNIAAASFYKVLGYRKALGYAVKSVKSLAANPIVYYTVKVNAWIVGLVGLTLALFITAVIQMIRNGESLYKFFKGRFPRRTSCILAVLTLFVVLVAPLFAGVLATLAVWSLVLSYCVRSCRWFAFTCGAVIALWGWAIPEISTIGFNVQQRINQVVQEINNRSFTPQGEDYIVRALERNPDDPLLLFALAELYQLKGLDAEAQKRYEEVVAKGGNKELLRVAAHMNLGTIEYHNNNLKAAEAMFEDIERKGYTSFELFYNLALTKLALLDTDAHRKYFAMAQKVDTRRAELIEKAQGELRHALMVPVPQEFYRQIIFQSVEESELPHVSEYLGRKDALASSLLAGGTPSRLGLAGLLCMLLSGISFKSHAGDRAGKKAARQKESSVLWLLVPAGQYIAGLRPVLGSLVLALLLALIVVALEAPIQFFGSLPVSVSFQSIIISSALTLSLLLVLLAVAGHAIQGRRE